MNTKRDMLAILTSSLQYTTNAQRRDSRQEKQFSMNTDWRTVRRIKLKLMQRKDEEL